MSQLYNLPASTEYSGGLSNFASARRPTWRLDVAKSVSLASITNITLDSDGADRVRRGVD